MVDKEEKLENHILAESFKQDGLDIDKIYTINRKLNDVKKQKSDQ